LPLCRSSDQSLCHLLTLAGALLEVFGVVVVTSQAVENLCDARRTAWSAPWVRPLRQSEIQHLHCAVWTNFDIRELEIAMDNPLLMCAASSASAICRAIGSASSTGMGPCAMRSASAAADPVEWTVG
jgi:hypothetical protein